MKARPIGRAEKEGARVEKPVGRLVGPAEYQHTRADELGKVADQRERRAVDDTDVEHGDVARDSVGRPTRALGVEGEYGDEVEVRQRMCDRSRVLIRTADDEHPPSAEHLRRALRSIHPRGH